MTDSEIAELLRLGCKAGAAALYDRYSRGLWLVIMRIVGNKIKAEIIFEQTFAAIWQEIASYQPGSEKLFTFMTRIARRKATVLR